MRIIEKHFPTPSDPIAREGAGLASFPATRQAGSWLFGTVCSVEPSNALLLLHQPEERIHQIVRWLPQTRIAHHGVDVQSDALCNGQQIAVQYAIDAGQKFAKEINIVIDPPPLASTGAPIRRQGRLPGLAKGRASTPRP